MDGDHVAFVASGGWRRVQYRLGSSLIGLIIEYDAYS